MTLKLIMVVMLLACSSCTYANVETASRTSITVPVKLRVDPEKAIDYRREDAQADLLGMMHPLTVVVGHTLHKDLDVLRLNVPVVLDISLLQLGQRQSHPGIASIVISCVQPLVRTVGDLIVVTQ